MRIGLGIDTGGTFTDAALVDRDTQKVLYSAKSPTTKHDLSVGIMGVLRRLPHDALKQTELVSFSTTLATNACVEDKGGRAALILMGYNEKLVTRLAGEYGLDNSNLHIVSGSHGQRGQPIEKPDYNRIRALALSLAPGLDAIGVAEYWGLRNPEYEQRAKAVIAESTGLPVAAAHELTDEINSLRRAATTLLNARLIPITAELMCAMSESLKKMGVTAPIMIVRGDGALMSEAYAREHPVETLLSGPAASVAGAIALSKLKDLMVVDIGGTTTDVAIVRAGRTALEKSGAQVGAWRTGTRAVAVRTSGLGGDTRLYFTGDSTLRLDTRRAMPLSHLCAQYPACMDELERIYSDGNVRGYSRAEFFIHLKQPKLKLDGEETEILSQLENKPLSIETLAERVGTRPYFIRTGRLEALGAIQRAALTLTDLWHITGEFTAFNDSAAILGADILSSRLNLTRDELVRNGLRLASERLYGLLCTHLIHRAYPSARTEDILKMGYNGCGDEFTLNLNCSLPIIGIGAPADMLLPEAAQRLAARYISPDEAGVGGAIGAITGPVLREVRVVIRPSHEAWGVDGFICHAPEEQAQFGTYQEAVKWGRKAAEQIAVKQASEMGARNIVCEITQSDMLGSSGGLEPASMLLETEIIALASGRA